MVEQLEIFQASLEDALEILSLQKLAYQRLKYIMIG